MKKPIIERNFRSDFDFILKLRDRKGKEIGFPSYDFEGKIFTDHHRHSPFPDHPYIFSKRGGQLKNCFDDKGRLHIVMNHHGLRPGRLMLELKSFIPNPMYEDGYKEEIDIMPLSIELVDGPGDSHFLVDDEEVLLGYVYYTAYEMAVAGGFEGSEAEFLEALSKIGDLGTDTEENHRDIVRLKSYYKALKRENLRLDKEQEKLVREVRNRVKIAEDKVEDERKRALKREQEIEDDIDLLKDTHTADNDHILKHLHKISHALKKGYSEIQKELSDLKEADLSMEKKIQGLNDYATGQLRRLGDDLYDETKRAKRREDEIEELAEEALSYYDNLEEYDELDLKKVLEL